MGLCTNRSMAVACVLVFAATPLYAQQPSDLDALRAEVARLRQALDAVEARLAAAQGAPPAPEAAAPQAPAAQAPAAPIEAGVPPGAAGAGGPEGSLPVYGGAV